MLVRRGLVGFAMVAGLGLASPLTAQTEFNGAIALVETPGSQGPVSKWILDGELPQFTLGHSAAPAEVPNPPVTIPFVVQSGAPKSALVLAPNGIGAGTDAPEASFHLLGIQGKAQIRVEETGGRVASRNLLRLINGGGATLRLDNTATGQAWSFGSTLGGSFFVGSTPGTASGLLLSPSGDLTIGGTLTQGSDRNSKQAIEPVDGGALLERVARLPLATWEYKDTAGVRHLGPMAQDFAAAFGLGADDKHIAPGDAAGVSLAAIQALKAENDELRARLAALESQVAALVPR